MSRVAFIFGVVSALVSGCLSRPLTEIAPTTSNRFVTEVAQSGVDKIDLLFMVDNSASMADKQEILRKAVPVLVRRLTSPSCIDATGAMTKEVSVQGKCAVGEPEFTPVADIHVGIVTSSLGAHGGTQACANEKAHLLGTLRPAGSNADPKLVFDASQTWNNTGFLAWDAEQRAKPPGANAPGPFKDSFEDMIEATGERGCGFEASLESWYRFLVDPEPPLNVVRDASTPPQTVRGATLVQHPDGTTTCEGCDLELLAQRKAFLRPDSLVAIVMLSDENDCSIREDGSGWLVATSTALPRSTSVCESDPNSACCRSCGQRESEPPNGCSPLTEDAACKVTTPRPDDSPNLRCFEQRRRFGFDLLYPVSRYVAALKSPMLTLQSDGKTQVRNPLYASTNGAPRDASRVFLAGIVGVPWQDIADDASLQGPELKYLSAAELTAAGRWKVLLGDDSSATPSPPQDPFMIESVTPRSGTNPITHDAIMPPDSARPDASPINGHEQNVPNHDDLQYACTFALTTPRQCVQDDNACDCSAKTQNGVADIRAVTAANSPLCQPRAGGMPSTQQNFAKAYPGTRELEVLRGLNDQGIVASICPKVVESADPGSDPSYGYNPAVGAIIDRLAVELKDKCLPRRVEADPDTHQVLCKVIEAQPVGACDCKLAGRGEVDPLLIPAVERELGARGHCGGTDQPSCSSFCKCEILQEQSAADLAACRAGQDAPPGFCYVDDPDSPAVKGCPSNEKRTLRFVDSDSAHRTPAQGAFAFITCIGAPIGSAGSGGTQGSAL